MKSSVRAVVLIMVSLSVAALGQWTEKPRTGSPEQMLPDRTNVAGMSGMTPELQAGLIDAQRNAAERRAVVHAEVWGLNLAEPQSQSQPKRNDGFLRYVLDRNEPVNTAGKEYTFPNLSPGYHTITVQLIAADDQPIGAKLVMTVHVPK
jgi:hypothetical protein